MRELEHLKKVFERFGGELLLREATRVPTYEAGVWKKLPPELRSLYSNTDGGLMYFKDSQVIFLPLEEVTRRLLAAYVGATILNYFPFMDVTDQEAYLDDDNEVTFYCIAGYGLDNIVVRGDRRSLNMSGGGSPDLDFVAHDMDTFVSWFTRCLERVVEQDSEGLETRDFVEGVDYNAADNLREQALQLLELAARQCEKDDATEVFALGLQLVREEDAALLANYVDFRGFIRLVEEFRPELLANSRVQEKCQEYIAYLPSLADSAIKELSSRGYKAELSDDWRLAIDVPAAKIPVMIDLTYNLQEAKNESAHQLLIEKIERVIDDVKNLWK